MSVEHIPYRETGFFSPLVLDYLSGDPTLREFYEFEPDIHSFTQIIENQKKRDLNREVLQSCIQKGYDFLLELEKENTILPQKVQENIACIIQPNSFTITTGHQLNLFTGPLYTIYKIISTIKLALSVEKANPGNKIIPLFWMASEDHDFAEINYTYLYGKKISWDIKPSGATGRISTQKLDSVVSRFLTTLGISPHLKDIENLFQKSYLQYGTLALATQALYHQLFGEYGLVILDADKPALKKEFSQILAQDLKTQKSYELVNESNKKLENLGYRAQVHPRPINIFYLEDDRRERIVISNQKKGVSDPPNVYSVLNSNQLFSEEEIDSEIKKAPEKFSPNVILRPLYQEKILPNLAYIGGGAEVSYWLSFKSTFNFYKVPFPALFLRNSAMIMHENQIEVANRLGISWKNLFQDSSLLIKDYVLRSSAKTLNLAKEKSEMESLFSEIEKVAFKVDPTLRQSSEAIMKQTFHKLNNLEKKLLKKEKNTFDVQISQIIKLKQSLFPNQSLQERSENFFQYYEIYGSGLLDRIFEALDPLEKEFTILSLKKSQQGLNIK